MNIRRALITLCLLVAGCARAPQAGSPASEPAADLWHRCRLPNIAEPLTCAEVQVPQDPDAPKGPTLSITVARLASHARSPLRDPVVFLAGGPGQGATAVAHQIAPMLASLRAERDLLFVDVRGTGRSSPLKCALGRGDAAFRAMLSPTLPGPQLRRCASQHTVDLNQFHTLNVVKDLEKVMETLGVEQVNVVAVSYGTRVALRWLSHAPKRLRSLVLDGVAPPQQALFASFAADAQRAWRLLAEACHASPVCRARYPQPDALLRDALDAAELPRQITVTSPLSGEPVSLSLNRAGLALAVRAVLYSPEFSAGLLFALDRARAGEWEPLLSLAGSLSAGVSDSMAIGALLSTCCAEDYQRISAGVVAPSPKGAFLGEAAVELLRSACSVWPHRAAPAGFHEPATGDAPTLLLSGEFDPVTPPPWAELAAKGLKNAQLRTLAGRGHGTLSAPCARRWLKQFIRAPDKPLSQCEQLGRRPPFWLRRQAPPS